MSLNVPYGCWLSLSISPRAMDLQHVSKCLQCLLAVTYYLNGSMELQHVSLYLLLLLVDSHYVSQCQGVAACISLSPIVADCFSLSLPVPWSCCMSLTVFYGYWMSLTVCLTIWSSYISLTVSHCYWLSLTVSMELLHVSHCLPWLLAVFSVPPVPWSCYISLIVCGFLSLTLPVP